MDLLFSDYSRLFRVHQPIEDCTLTVDHEHVVRESLFYPHAYKLHVCEESSSKSLSKRKITFFFFFGNTLRLEECANYHKINYAFIFVVSLAAGHVAV